MEVGDVIYNYEKVNVINFKNKVLIFHIVNSSCVYYKRSIFKRKWNKDFLGKDVLQEKTWVIRDLKDVKIDKVVYKDIH